ncbi:hypothetical protein AwEntero_31190 [Enterobacterales bacterium]|nr:hypothetical protein AwEntero_31190 [Enterobacterales bacterium]
MGLLLVNDQGRQHDDASRVITGGDLTTLTFERRVTDTEIDWMLRNA